jgi:glucan phosphoethanolaminetransferase (alkaline phosphatase superfamily)
VIDFLKGILFLVPTIFTGLIIFFVPEIADTLSIFYVALIGTFLGLDIVNMIKKTESMPKGQYDKMKAWRYILSVFCIAVLLCVAFYRYKSDGSMKITLGSLSSCVIIICGVVIAGLDGNKIATREGVV